MKKIVQKLNLKLIIAVFSISSVIGYYSCTREKENVFSLNKLNDTCQTCTTVEGTPLNTTIFNQPYDFINYTGLVSYGIKDLKSGDELNNLLDHINLGALNIIASNRNVVGLAIYSKIRSEEIDNLVISDVDGFLIYYTENGSPVLKTKLLINRNSAFELEEYFSTTTKYVSSNDILELSQKLFSDTKGVLFFVRNKEGFLNFENDQFTEFSGRVRYSTFAGAYEPTDGSYCTKPCKTPMKDYLCTTKESPYKPSSDYCAPSGNLFCGEEKTEAVLINSNNANSDDCTNIKEELRTFRDDFLRRSRKGVFYISLYYYLSEKVNNDFYTLSNCVEVFDVLSNDILPMIYKINNNSSEILISEQSKNRILNLLNKVDASIGERDHEQINLIKSDINSFYGMSAIDVKNYIKSN